MGAVVFAGPSARPPEDDRKLAEVAPAVEPAEADHVETAPVEPAAFSEAVVEDAATDLPLAVSKPAKRRRARHPKGHPEGGHFVGDDPATPDVNEAWVKD